MVRKTQVRPGNSVHYIQYKNKDWWCTVYTCTVSYSNSTTLRLRGGAVGEYLVTKFLRFRAAIQSCKMLLFHVGKPQSAILWVVRLRKILEVNHPNSQLTNLEWKNVDSVCVCVRPIIWVIVHHLIKWLRHEMLTKFFLTHKSRRRTYSGSAKED